MRYPLIMVWGETPSSMKCRTSFINSPANNTTLVVPSPTCESIRKQNRVRKKINNETNLSILGACNIHQSLGSGMNDIQQSHNCGTVIGNRCFPYEIEHAQIGKETNKINDKLGNCKSGFCKISMWHYEKFKEHTRKNKTIDITIAVNNEFIHATWTQSRSNHVHDRETSIDIVEHLAFALWSVRSFTKQNNLRLLRHEFSWKRRRKRKREK